MSKIKLSVNIASSPCSMDKTIILFSCFLKWNVYCLCMVTMINQRSVLNVLCQVCIRHIADHVCHHMVCCVMHVTCCVVCVTCHVVLHMTHHVSVCLTCLFSSCVSYCSLIMCVQTMCCITHATLCCVSCVGVKLGMYSSFIWFWIQEFLMWTDHKLTFGGLRCRQDPQFVFNNMAKMEMLPVTFRLTAVASSAAWFSMLWNHQQPDLAFCGITSSLI